jgi:2-polyprenyl-3-methyl-5-hydroxy-6-metoxy-1,4-benzoquinol methylase
LLYRAPTSSEEENQKYYQEEYRQGYTTDMPSPVELERLLATGFIGTERDYSDKIAVLKALSSKSGDALFDYGCSWGYGSWQLAKSGFQVTGFEISEPRAAYAREYLGINVISKLSEINKANDLIGKFDFFFSCHVVEHVPSVSAVLDLAFHFLKPRGLLVVFTPNGSLAYRNTNPTVWHTFWGFVHTNFLDDVYYDAYFTKVSRLLASSPYDLKTIHSTRLENGSKIALSLNGPELLLAARKESSLTSNWSS